MNSRSVMEHSCVHTLTRAIKPIRNSSTCQSKATTGCLLLLQEQCIKTQRVRRLLLLCHSPSLPHYFIHPTLPPSVFLPSLILGVTVALIFPPFNSLISLIETAVQVACEHFLVLCFVSYINKPQRHVFVSNDCDVCGCNSGVGDLVR